MISGAKYVEGAHSVFVASLVLHVIAGFAFIVSYLSVDQAAL